MSTFSEYLPVENDNGNGNGNGKTNGKAFILAQPKTPAQIRREALLATMPKLRRDCSRDPRLTNHVGAKWLFGQVSDLTFIEDFGGQRDGRLFMSLRDMSKLFHVHRNTLAAWRQKLSDTGWIWFIERWPRCEWGICGICNQPELFPPNFESVGYGGVPAEQAQLPETSKSADLGQNGLPDRPAVPAEQATLAGGTGMSGRTSRPVLPAEQARLAGGTGQTGRTSRPVWPAEQARLAVLQATDAGAAGRIEESPGNKEVGRPDKAVNRVGRGKRAFKAPRRVTDDENGFLQVCLGVLTKPEMEENGGLWRTLYRQNTGKAWRVISELQRMLKEGVEIRTTPAKTAMDLWKRFSD
jgi:hypothetical protein